MKSLTIYEDYTRILFELSVLQNQYASLDPAATQAKRIEIQNKINSCRTKLTSITNAMIHSNPFQKGRRVKQTIVRERVH